MIFFFMFSCLLLSIDSNGQTKTKTALPKESYQKLDNGKMVKIRKDSVVVDSVAPKKIIPANKKPTIDFDTSFIPREIFTQHIEELLKTTNVLGLAKNVTNKMLENAEKKDPENEQLQLFYKRFSLKINSPSFDSLFMNLYIRNYRKYFTDEDVQQLLAFYKTPAGNKYLKLLPSITVASMAEGEKLGKYFGALVIYELEEEKRNK